MKALLAISVLLIFSLGCVQPPSGAGNNTNGSQVACTAEAKLCPDGSSVGRTGPNCEFAPCPQTQLVGNDTDVHGCKASAGYSWCQAQQKCMRPWEEACQGSLTDSQVMQIAQAGCGSTGNLVGNITYNSYTKTYWIDLDTVKEGCSPACVVWEENQSAEVNWRCTGLITPPIAYTVTIANTSLGQVLVDGTGFTLYTLSSDSANKSTCSGSCATNWPPLLLTSGTIDAPSAVVDKIGAFARDSSSIQVTYDQMPLYRYAGDSNPGDTNGQGIGGKWYVVKITG